MGDAYAAKLGRIADEMDRGAGDRREWAEGVRRVLEDRADERGRWVAHIRSCEETIRAHKGLERGLKVRLAEAEAEAARLRNELARLEGRTHGHPTEAELSPELRARLMPEGLEWPRFEDGEPVRLGDETDMTWPVTSVAFERFHGGDLETLVGDDSGSFSLEPGELVRRPARKDFPKGAPEEGPSEKNPQVLSDDAWARDFLRHHQRLMAVAQGLDEARPGERPEPPATPSRGRRDTVAPGTPAAKLPNASQSGSIGITDTDKDAEDSWERLGEDIMGFGVGYASTLPDEADRERDALVARAKALAEGPDVDRPGEVV